MKVEIKGRFRPFSSTPGTIFLIPGSELAAQIFPSLVRLYNVKDGKLVSEREITSRAPSEEFVVFQDLEKGYLSVYSGVRYHILPNGEILFKKRCESLNVPTERLSLGSHRKQEWETLKRKRDFQTLFPFWHRLGSFYPKSEGNSSLLDEIKEVIACNRPEKIISSFEKFFLVHFRGLFTPRFEDEEFQRIAHQKASGDTPLFLLSESASLIRSLFIQEENQEIHILPHLAPQFFSGRMVDVKLPLFGTLHFEWTKKMIRRVILESRYTGDFHLRLPNDIRSFRVRVGYKDRGSIYQKGKLAINSGELYLLDRFQK